MMGQQTRTESLHHPSRLPAPTLLVVGEVVRFAGCSPAYDDAGLWDRSQSEGYFPTPALETPSPSAQPLAQEEEPIG